MTTQKQHVDFYKKILLRKALLKHALDGACYVPFIGEGDIASELYAGKWQIYGADIDAARVATARARLPDDSSVIVADCDKWVFPGCEAEFSVCDFDAYGFPYGAFREFWSNHGAKSSGMVLFFTDGGKLNVARGYNGKTLKYPSGETRALSKQEWRSVFNFYFPKHIKPWFIEYVKPYRVMSVKFYLRGMMLYWGAVIQR